MRRLHLTSALAGILLPCLLLAGSPVATAAPAGPAGTLFTEPQEDPFAEPVENPPGDLGTWSVTATGPDTWTVAWTAPDRLPVGADRPTIVASDELAGVEAGAPLGVPTVADDGRSVEVSVVAVEQPAPASLDVVLSGEALDEGASAGPTAPPTTGRWKPPVQELLDVDPGRRGDLPTVTSDYVRPGIEIPRMRADVEMVGHVVKPAAAVADASDPLVMFLHGRHSYCYNPDTGRIGWHWPCAGAQVPIPSHLGYDYIQQVLASQGYVTVSIAANGINAQDDNTPDGGAAARSQLVQAHLDQWAAWAGSKHQVDLDKVMLVGHSRGGEGVSRASLEIPLGAPYTVVGQVLIGPTNFGRQTTPYVPTVTVLPSCDGDVIDLQGQSYTDIARGLADGDTAMKSSVMSVGANHNYFNTEWTPGLAAAPAWDDWAGRGGVCRRGVETRLTAAEQRRVGKAYVAGAVHLFADGDQDYRPMFDGSAARVGSAGDAAVLTHMVGGDRTVRLPGTDAALTTPVGAATVLCEGTTPWARTQQPQCGRYVRSPEDTPHWPTTDSLVPTFDAFQMSWEAPAARGGLVLATPLDLTGSDWLDLRTVVDPLVGDVSLRVRLVAQGGAAVVVDPVGGRELPALPSTDRWMPGKHWAQTLRVDVDDVTGIDASQVKRIELVGTSDRGRVWVLDVAAASELLPAVPARRVPIVDLGQVKVDEGGEGTHVAEVPFTVSGEVTDPGEFWVYAFTGGEQGEPVRVDVDVPVGADAGAVELEYDGDDLDSYPRSIHELIGHAIRNVMMRDNAGRLVVLDDDPTPELSFAAVRPRVLEGDFAELEAELSAPTGYDMGVTLEIISGEGPAAPLRAHDVTLKWLKRWTSWREGTDPELHRLPGGGQFGWFSAGETRLTFRIPIRDDTRSERRESLTVVASTEQGWLSEPVTVHVPAND